MHAEDEFDVVIAGGGPVGMGLAIELGLRDIRTLVIERYAQPQSVPKGQNLTQRTMEHFHFWGIEDQLRAARTIPSDYGIGGLTAYGSLTSPYRYDWLQRELVRPYYFTDNERLPQYCTEAVLRARVAQLPSIAARYGYSVARHEADGDGVTVHAVERNGEARLKARGRFLVGCDGSRSTVRQTAQISQTLSDHDKLMVLLVFRSDELARILARYPGKSFYNVLHPDLEGYWLFFGRVDLENQWFFHAPVPRSAREDGFDFKAYLEKAVGAPIDVAFDHIGFWDLRFAIADRYRADHVFLAGDAAHSHPPYGGYGINTGFEDACNLGWKLAAVLQGWGGDDLLESYHAERHGVFASTAGDFIERAINEDRAFLSTHDPTVDEAAFIAEWQRRSVGAQGEVASFEPHYEGSPIVPATQGAGGSAVGRHSHEARAGHHLSPADRPSGGNVYDELGLGFTLFLFGEGGEAPGFRAAAQALGMPLKIVHEPAPALCARYGAQAILVRPDQFVAWADKREGRAPAEILSQSIGR